MTTRLHGRPPALRRRAVGVVVGAVLVLVLVAGAVGLAVASPARTVTITVIDDAHRPTTAVVQSHAERVGDVLAQAGVTPGAQDEVVPGTDDPVGEDNAIRLTRAREIDLSIDGRPRHVTTPLRTVGELLASLDLPAGTRAAVPGERDLETVPRPLTIATPKELVITADGRTRTVRSAAPTVRQAVTEQGITVGPRDQITPDPAAVPTAHLRISLTRIASGPTVRERETVPFSTEVRQDPTRWAGETVVVRAGVPGEIVRTFATRSVDGQVRGRVLVGTATVRQPVSRIVSVGTLDRPGQAVPDDGAAMPGPGLLPAPVDPAPQAPAEPAPTEPAPVDPAPQAPADPAPQAPAEPDPSEPAPSEPVDRPDPTGPTLDRGETPMLGQNATEQAGGTASLR